MKNIFLNHVNSLKKVNFSTTITNSNGGKLSNYRYFLAIQTRWNDNDQYGHVNNSIYHKYADTIINNYLIWYCGLRKNKSKETQIGYMVDTQCQYKKPLNYPQTLIAGLGVSKIGKSSVSYKVAFFEPKLNYNTVVDESKFNEDPLIKLQIESQGKWAKNAHDILQLKDFYYDDACVISRSVHVFVDSVTNKPVESLSDTLKTGLQEIVIPYSIESMLQVKNVHRLIKCFSTKAEEGWNIANYRYFMPIQTRWADNDQFGHINNAVYYMYIDSVVTNGFYSVVVKEDGNRYGAPRVETSCSYRKPLSYPQTPLAGLGISKIGKRSFQFCVGFFEPNTEEDISLELGIRVKGSMLLENDLAKLSKYFQDTASVLGRCTSVFVKTANVNQSAELPPHILEKMKGFMIKNHNEDHLK